MAVTYIGDLRAVDFLSNFDSETRAQIIEFGKRISSKDLAADVYLIMARKAICFVDLLLQFKLATLNGVIITDRVLDTDLSWLKGKSVTIIDDALVSGTTIRKAIDKVKKYVDDSKIKVYVLTINYDWYKRESTDSMDDYPHEMLVRTDINGNVLYDCDGKARSYLEKPLNYQTNEKCMRTCFDIVKALSNTPKPYDVDFPFYEDLKIDEKKLNELLNSSWLPIKIVSTEYKSEKYAKRQKSNEFTAIDTKCDSISFFPPHRIAEKIKKLFGIKYLSNGALKVRTYIRERKKEHSEYHISFLPFAIVNELLNKDIDEILKKVILNSNIEFSDVAQIFISYSSRFRLIQFLIAGVVAHEFFGENNLFIVDTATGDQHFPKLSNERIGYIFPISSHKVIENILQSLYKTQVDNFESNNDYYAFEEGGNNDISNPVLIFERLADEFLHLYREKEIKARSLAKEYGHKVFSQPDYNKVVNRLDEGKTFDDLLHTKIPKVANSEVIELISLCDLPNAELIVSTFLDYAIDIGIAVPITYSKSDSVSRAYRHGEDVIFSDEEARLLAYMLYTFFKTGVAEKEIGGLLAEKLFSTFIRLGLANRIFNKYDYDQINSQAREYLKITYNLHGSTVRLYDSSDKIIPKAYVTTDDVSKWLWEVLADKKFIVVNKKKQGEDDNSHSITFSGECIKNIENLKDTDKGIDAERIAETIGYCYQKEYLNTNDLILLNATYGHEEVIPALLAEIEIIRNSFFIKFDYHLRKAFQSWHILNFLQANRNSPAFIAMNSGNWKFENFHVNFASDKIRTVKETLDKEAPREISRNWVQMWKEKLSTIEDEQLKETVDILLCEANCIIQYNLIYRLLEYLAFQKTIGKDKILSYFKTLKELLCGVEKAQYKLTIEEYNASNGMTSIMSYFKILGVEKKINAKNINDDDFIQSTANAEEMIKDILLFIDKLNYISSLRPLCKSSDLVQESHKILHSSNYVQEYFEYLLKQISLLNDTSESLQRYASKYINMHGKIEKPIEYKNVALIVFATERAMDFCNEIKNRIFERRKRITKPGVDLNYEEIDSGILIYTVGNGTDDSLCLLLKQINCELNIDNDLELYCFLNLESMYCPYRFSASRTNCTNLYEYMWQVVTTLQKEELAFSIIARQKSDFSKEARNLGGKIDKKIKCGEKKDIMVKAISKNDNSSPRILKGFTLGILCAKPTELTGVEKALKDKFNANFCEQFDDKENYRRNLIAYIQSDNIQHTIILTQCEQGNTGSAIVYSSLSHFKPDYVIFSGIAGSCNKDVNIGDVFIPFTILDVTLKKAVNDRLLIRGDAYKIPAHHKGLLAQFTSECINTIQEQGLNFNLTNDSAMSDNTVVACDDNEYLRSILAVNDKSAACIEMESAGLFDADYNRHKTKFGVYSIRGISDKANTAKDDSHHSLAIHNASLVTAELINFLFKKYSFIKTMKII